jgi:hypothetical protein
MQEGEVRAPICHSHATEFLFSSHASLDCFADAVARKSVEFRLQPGRKQLQPGLCIFSDLRDLAQEILDGPDVLLCPTLLRDSIELRYKKFTSICIMC